MCNRGVFNRKKSVFFMLSIVILLSIMTPLICAQDHPIEKWTEECMNRDFTTLGMRMCLSESYEKWDRELNRLYHALRKELTNEGKEALRHSQKLWIKFRDAEFQTLESVYGSLEGSIWSPVMAQARVEIVKHRAMELKGRLESLTLP